METTKYAVCTGFEYVEEYGENNVIWSGDDLQEALTVANDNSDGYGFEMSVILMFDKSTIWTFH